MWGLEPNLVPYKTSRVEKIALEESSRPLDPPRPPKTPQSPKKKTYTYLVTLPTPNLVPLVIL